MFRMIPGMMFASAMGKPVVGRLRHLTQEFLTKSKNLDNDFKTILRSLITGNWEAIPEDLCVLLDSAQGDD